MQLLERRAGAVTTPQPDELIEIEQQLGYKTADGTFVVVCDLRPLVRHKKKQARDLLKKFLDATPNLREKAKAGLVSFSVQNGVIYCHTMAAGSKANGPGSPGRACAIDDWMKVNLTAEQYARETRQSGLLSCRL